MIPNVTCLNIRLRPQHEYKFLGSGKIEITTVCPPVCPQPKKKLQHEYKF